MPKLVYDHQQETTLDLTALRAITDGDAALEAELFSMFLETGKRCLIKLQDALSAPEPWSEAAHELKGMALQLGALRLQNLCSQAELMPASEEVAVRRNMQQDIASAFDEVVAALDSVQHHP